MSTNEDTFHFPFISNLIQSRFAGTHARTNQRTAPMKEIALCLDDDPLSLRLVEHLLKKRYHVISCANVDSAIRAVKQHRCGLFLCDYHLGDDITGAQAWESLSREHGFSPAHRVLITSYPSAAIEEESRSVGFDRVFAKPLRREFQQYCLNLFMPAARRPIAAV